MKTQNFGYILCRDCGMELNPADAVSGLCPECSKKRADHLAYLQTMYQSAVDGGDERTSESVARLIREYQQSEGVRLKDVLPAYRVN